MQEVTLQSDTIATTDRQTQQLYDNLLKILSDLESINSAASLIQQEEMGTFGSNTTVPVITIDKKQNITSIVNTAIAFPMSTIGDTNSIDLTIGAGILTADCAHKIVQL